MRKLTWKKTKEFLWRNKGTILQLGIICGTVALMGDTSFAQDAADSNDLQGIDMSGYTKLTAPLAGLQNTLVGPVAKGVGVIGIVTCGLATAANMEQQVVKRGLQILGGAGAGMGAASVIATAGSSLTFL
jgi:type IV secretory pathway VirB2 component (pilin)